MVQVVSERFREKNEPILVCIADRKNSIDYAISDWPLHILNDKIIENQELYTAVAMDGARAV